MEDRSVCQLTEDLVEFYHLLYSQPRFLSQQALDRPLCFLSLSLSSLSLSIYFLNKKQTQAEAGDSQIWRVLHATQGACKAEEVGTVECDT